MRKKKYLQSFLETAPWIGSESTNQVKYHRQAQAIQASQKLTVSVMMSINILLDSAFMRCSLLQYTISPTMNWGFETAIVVSSGEDSYVEVRIVILEVLFGGDDG